MVADPITTPSVFLIYQAEMVVGLKNKSKKMLFIAEVFFISKIF